MPNTRRLNTEAELVPVQDALIYVMVMLSASDAHMTDKELSVIGDIVRHLPVFTDFNPDRLLDVARDCTSHLQQPDGMLHTLHVIRDSLPERMYETAYAVACDVAAADGGVSQEELRLLELLRHELNIDRLHAAALERGASARYLTA